MVWHSSESVDVGSGTYYRSRSPWDDSRLSHRDYCFDCDCIDAGCFYRGNRSKGYRRPDPWRDCWSWVCRYDPWLYFCLEETFAEIISNERGVSSGNVRRYWAATVVLAIGRRENLLHEQRVGLGDDAFLGGDGLAQVFGNGEHALLGDAIVKA